MSDECYVCNWNTHLYNGLCQYNKKEIKDCTVYETEWTCKICDMKIPSYDKTYCDVLVDYDQNCRLFSYPLTCNKCKPGYKLNKNLFLKNID